MAHAWQAQAVHDAKREQPSSVINVAVAQALARVPSGVSCGPHAPPHPAQQDPIVSYRIVSYRIVSYRIVSYLCELFVRAILSVLCCSAPSRWQVAVLVVTP